ncbi:MAG: protease modulator HflK N-terminal domain-containing protein, partial [Mariprofundaceae bacterium]|nr:protease modulator HflK N-terminal domain-containing protein [Mariprofundaceae bacterium]
MPWNDQNQQNNPWGNKPGQQPPDLDEVIRRLQQRLSGMFGGGGGSGGGGISGPGKGVVMGGIVLALLLWVASGIYMVAADEEAVVLRFGKFVATTGPG